MWPFKKKIKNPKIEEFEAHIEQRGLSLVPAGTPYTGSGSWMEDEEGFVSYAKSSGLKTIFVDRRDIAYVFHSRKRVVYFYSVNGLVMCFTLDKKVVVV